MRFEMAMIGPELAIEYLTKNEGNRRLDMNHVRRLANDMREGHWSTNGDTIRFNTEGILIDGQHRLNAIVLANVRVQMAVLWDIEDPNAFKTIDTNSRARGIGQVLGLMGVKNSAYTASIARRLVHWDRVMDKSKYSLEGAAYRKVTSADMIAYVEKNNEEIQDMILRIKSTLVFKRCGAGSSLITALIICNRLNEEKTREMVRILHSGYDKMEDSPVIKLRDRLFDPPERRGHRWDTEIMAFVLKAFDKFRKEEPLKKLMWSQVELFPVLEGFEQLAIEE